MRTDRRGPERGVPTPRLRHRWADSPLAAPRRTGANGSVLRYGVRPLLLALDLAAFLSALSVTGSARGANLALFGLIVVLYANAGLYRSRLSLSVLDDLPALLGRPLAAGAVATSVDVLLDSAGARPDLLFAAAWAGVIAVAYRGIGYAVVRSCRRRRLIVHPTLVLGAGRVGGHVARLLLAHPEYGLRPVGFIDADPLLAADEQPVPVLGGHHELARVIVEFGVHDVIVAFGSAPESEMVDILRTCDRLHAEIFFVPRLFEMSTAGRDMDQIWGVPLVRLRRAAFRTFGWKVKRALDVVVSGIAVVLLAPVLGACALAVRWELGRGVLFRQERVGLDGRRFNLLKFRTVPSHDEGDTLWTVSGDSRVGPVGRLLRRTSLDELPQLWNILRGDMSLVGPRPERPYFVSAFAGTFPRYADRHRVPSGLTGWAQVHGLRGDTSIEDRARFDNFYIENWSIWGDLKIALRTAGQILGGRGR